MTWGLEKYAHDYVKTVEALYPAGIKPKERRLGYADALRKEISQVVRDVFNNTVQISRDESAKFSPSIEELENAVWSCKFLNNQCTARIIRLDNGTESKTFCGTHYCCAQHGIAFLKTRRAGLQCCVCLKSQQQKRKIGEAMHEHHVVVVFCGAVYRAACQAAMDSRQLSCVLCDKLFRYICRRPKQVAFRSNQILVGGNWDHLVKSP
ncbi:hypothetical protein BDR22DRAFT_967208 [Usnea florida]